MQATAAALPCCCREVDARTEEPSHTTTFSPPVFSLNTTRLCTSHFFFMKHPPSCLLSPTEALQQTDTDLTSPRTGTGLQPWEMLILPMLNKVWGGKPIVNQLLLVMPLCGKKCACMGLTQCQAQGSLDGYQKIALLWQQRLHETKHLGFCKLGLALLFGMAPSFRLIRLSSAVLQPTKGGENGINSFFLHCRIAVISTQTSSPKSSFSSSSSTRGCCQCPRRMASTTDEAASLCNA